jgi:hypothetical protein
LKYIYFVCLINLEKNYKIIAIWDFSKRNGPEKANNLFGAETHVAKQTEAYVRQRES